MARKSSTKTNDKNIENDFITQTCKVLSYNSKSKNLDVDFNGYGIRIKNIKDFKDDIATIKYKGKFGTANFVVTL